MQATVTQGLRGCSAKSHGGCHRKKKKAILHAPLMSSTADVSPLRKHHLEELFKDSRTILEWSHFPSISGLPTQPYGHNAKIRRSRKQAERKSRAGTIDPRHGETAGRHADRPSLVIGCCPVCWECGFSIRDPLRIPTRSLVAGISNVCFCRSFGRGVACPTVKGRPTDSLGLAFALHVCVTLLVGYGDLRRWAQ
jgi:hypothetical protein